MLSERRLPRRAFLEQLAALGVVAGTVVSSRDTATRAAIFGGIIGGLSGLRSLLRVQAQQGYIDTATQTAVVVKSLVGAVAGFNIGKAIDQLT